MYIVSVFCCLVMSINRPYSYSRYWTGTSFAMEANAGEYFQMQILFNIFPRISLHCKLVQSNTENTKWCIGTCRYNKVSSANNLRVLSACKCS